MLQRRVPPKTLTRIAGAHGRDQAVFNAYASGGYRLNEIRDYFGLHYSRVNFHLAHIATNQLRTDFMKRHQPYFPC